MAEDVAQDGGLSISDCSLQPVPRTFRAVSSFPFLKPNLKATAATFLRFNKILKTKERDHETENFTFDQSKSLIKQLAMELNRVIQLKFPLIPGKVKKKGTEEEQRHYIVHWAEEVETVQDKDAEEEENEGQKVSTWSGEANIQNASKILTDWFYKLRKMKRHSIQPKEECKDTLRRFQSEWRRGESSVLPVLDVMVWTVLHPDDDEVNQGIIKDSVHRNWIKKRSKNKAGFQIPISVWQWIKTSTADVNLDKNTANPELIVSEKAVKSRPYYKDADPWNRHQRSPNRFDGWTCVQGEEGFEAGRHYWQVDVRRKREWRVGLVKESAVRNGYVTMNTRSGYWNLRLYLGTLMALTEPVTKLDRSAPSVIGVYLDVEEGLVSFYDANRRSHIYTFNADLTGAGKVYPMFGTTDTDVPLRILP